MGKGELLYTVAGIINWCSHNGIKQYGGSPQIKKKKQKKKLLYDPAEKAMVPHSSTLAWKIPWMEEPGGLQSMGLLRVGHN